MRELFTLKRNLYWLLAVTVTALLAWVLIAFAPQPTASGISVPPVSVSVVKVSAEAMSIPVHSRGYLTMAREFQLSSQVQGRVLSVSDHFVSGAYVRAGETLLTIDPQPYQLELSRRQAELDARLLQQEQTRAQAEVAQQQAAENDYARFIPQLRMANSQVKAAQEALNYARQQLQNTQINAPVSGRVAAAHVQPGQQVSPELILGTIDDNRWQEVALPVSDGEALLLGIHGRITDAEHTDSPLQVTLHSGGVQLRAHIVRSEAHRAAFQQIVLIARPDYQPGDAQLLPGTYVEADIFSPVIQGITRIPRPALQAGNRLLLVDNQQRLQSSEADIIYRDKTHIYLRNYLGDNVRLVNSSRRSLTPGSVVQPIVSTGIQPPAASQLATTGQE